MQMHHTGNLLISCASTLVHACSWHPYNAHHEQYSYNLLQLCTCQAKRFAWIVLYGIQMWLRSNLVKQCLIKYCPKVLSWQLHIILHCKKWTRKWDTFLLNSCQCFFSFHVHDTKWSSSGISSSSLPLLDSSGLCTVAPTSLLDSDDSSLSSASSGNGLADVFFRP